ncbi:MAG: glycosyltransferase family 4 protein [Arsenophonus sp.]|nr:MAG: glycosyltransferase family 4 protein [Arsenophonus sp.]
MEITFCIYKYFPYGGLQKKFIKILLECQKRGYKVRVYSMSWRGKIPKNIKLILFLIKKYSNHKKNESFYKKVTNHIKKFPTDIILGFNKMPGLDFYYVGDVCFADLQKNFFYKLTNRYKHYLKYEHAVFNIKSNTKLLVLTKIQIKKIQKYYQTQNFRFYKLLPGIEFNKNLFFKERINQYRKNKNIVLLQIGSDFYRKGLGRTIRAIFNLPNYLKDKVKLIVIGESSSFRYKLYSFFLGLYKKIIFLNGRNNIYEFMNKAHLLIHPAYQEAGGNVLLEAIVCALPVITTVNCGYSFYIKKAKCGIVLNLPYQQKKLNKALIYALNNNNILKKWSKSAFFYSKKKDFYGLTNQVVDIITNKK